MDPEIVPAIDDLGDARMTPGHFDTGGSHRPRRGDGDRNRGTGSISACASRQVGVLPIIPDGCQSSQSRWEAGFPIATAGHGPVDQAFPASHRSALADVRRNPVDLFVLRQQLRLQRTVVDEPRGCGVVQSAGCYSANSGDRSGRSRLCGTGAPHLEVLDDFLIGRSRKKVPLPRHLSIAALLIDGVQHGQIVLACHLHVVRTKAGSIGRCRSLLPVTKAPVTT